VLDICNKQDGEDANKHVEVIVVTFDKSQHEAQKRRLVEKAKNKKLAIVRSMDRKQETVKTFLDKLANHIDDKNPWKGIALSYCVTPYGGTVGHMKNGFVLDVVGEYIKALSKVTNEKISECKEQIEQAFLISCGRKACMMIHSFRPHQMNMNQSCKIISPSVTRHAR
jgi:hypothetical protein